MANILQNNLPHRRAPRPWRAAQCSFLRLLGGAVIFATLVAVNGFAESDRVDFSREILPVLSENCFYCHGPDASHRKARLRLDDEADAKRDRDGERVIFPGNSAKSLLVERITTEDLDDRMPPVDSHKTLTATQISRIKRWIDEGAAWGQHWAFEKISRPAVPKISSSGSIKNPIDAFIRERLQQEKLKPSPPASKNTLIRRVSLDLTGLPPTPQEVEDFLNDKSPAAYERLVDRLLASPAYGERMAWDWMEVSRYADSNGYQGDAERTMWPWRDWVIQAFNENMPYDRFTVLQLAGDLLPDASTEEKLATAFCRNHPINGEGGRIAEENRVEYAMDMVETTGTVWLGLTFNCTRCHDHKFDPLTQRDYYSLLAYFNQTPVDGSGGSPQTRPVLEMPTPEQRERLIKLDEQIATQAAALSELEKKLFAEEKESSSSESSTEEKRPEEIRKLLNKAASKRKRAELEQLEKHFQKTSPAYAKKLRELTSAMESRDDVAASIPKVMVMEDRNKPRKTYILQGGLYNKPGEEVWAATPEALPKLSNSTGSNRLALARWLVSPENPLTPRVTVNRIWQMFFGTGLVRTPEDFGRQGELPSHPELLDWLAAEFRDMGWDVKKLVRLIVTSETYRQSSRVTDELRERDPENRLLARAPRFRMPSWMLRDQALAVSGLLVNKIGGPPVKVYQPAGVWEEATFGIKKYKQDSGEALYRRSLYVFWRRIIGPTEFFDTASRMTCNVKPTRNNTPLHALTTLNDVTYVEAARHLAARSISDSKSPEERANRVFRLVLCREPQPQERAALISQFEETKKMFADAPDDAAEFLSVGDSPNDKSLDPIEHAAWTAACLAVLNLDETLTKE